jgi:hypothetical protein
VKASRRLCGVLSLRGRNEKKMLDDKMVGLDFLFVFYVSKSFSTAFV